MLREPIEETEFPVPPDVVISQMAIAFSPIALAESAVNRVPLFADE